ncbi:hypothetical protein C8R43DRAFT_1132598 [Mycena crocata]|nr:hypothetical protein C8R43DRAFT_1132598 [Mycena crocata]
MATSSANLSCMIQHPRSTKDPCPSNRLSPRRRSLSRAHLKRLCLANLKTLCNSPQATPTVSSDPTALLRPNAPDSDLRRSRGSVSESNVVCQLTVACLYILAPKTAYVVHTAHTRISFPPSLSFVASHILVLPQNITMFILFILSFVPPSLPAFNLALPFEFVPVSTAASVRWLPPPSTLSVRRLPSVRSLHHHSLTLTALPHAPAPAQLCAQLPAALLICTTNIEDIRNATTTSPAITYETRAQHIPDSAARPHFS